MPSAVQKQKGKIVKAVACAVVGCVAVLIIGMLAFGSNDQHAPKAVASATPVEHSDGSLPPLPPLSPKLGPDELLKKEAANLNSGKSGDEEWTQVTYDIWDGKGRLNTRQGAIRGVRRGFADGTEGIRLEYTVYLGFENGAWSVKEITGNGIRTAQLLTNLAVLKTPRIVTPRGSEVTISDVQSQIDQMKAQEKAQKSWGQNFFAVSDIDRNIISARLAQPSTEATSNNGSLIPQYVIAWDDLYDILKSNALTELQQKERWAEFEGRMIHWYGTVCSVSEDASEHISMDVEVSLGEWTGSQLPSSSSDHAGKATDYRLCKGGNVEVTGQIGSSPNVKAALLDSEKANALRLRKGDGVEFTGEIGSLPNHDASEILISDSKIGK